MISTLARLESSCLTLNENARLRCEAALELKDRGEYARAQEIMRPFWRQLGEHPDTSGLHDSMAAEMLLVVGILTRWIGSKNQIKEASQIAGDLISESINFYESEKDAWKVAAARSELGFCYWRSGALDEARVMFTEALKKLTAEGNTRATALIGLSVVEWSAMRFHDALAILTNNAHLFKKISNETTRGTYHNQSAMILRSLATAENRCEYFERALVEYQQADQCFQRAHNLVYRANVLNNVGFLLLRLGRFQAAEDYISTARKLAVTVRDKILIAQFDDSRAKLLIATERLNEGEQVARGAVNVFDKAGQPALLADALITYGVALARVNKSERAQFAFQKAIDVARTAGALGTAGLAALSLIEEIDRLPSDTIAKAYEQAGEWLSTCQSAELWERFKAAGIKVTRELRGDGKQETTTSFNQPCHLEKELLQFERRLISRALASANGKITHAAEQLGIGRQRLAYMIAQRHPDLLAERTPVRRRPRGRVTA